MERIPEPELMSEEAQAIAYAQADFSEPHSRFVSLFMEKFSGMPVVGTVLDLGCGPADISRRFATSHPQCRIHGIDGSPAMLQEGRALNADYGLSERIDLFEVYLPAPALPLPQYDVVISNSLLHHLHDPTVLWRSVKQFAAPGAPVFVMDLLRPHTREDAERMVSRYASGEPDILRVDFLASLCAAFTQEEIAMQLHNAHLDTLQTAIVSDRHVIIFGQMP